VRIDLPQGQATFDRMGSGLDLVMLHSLLTDRDAFDPVIPELASRWRVTKLDLPGFGGSTLCGSSIDDYARFVGAFLATAGYDPVTTALMGNGLGGFVALGVAVRFGDSFDRLVLAGCGAAFPEAGRVGFAQMADRVSAGGMEAIVEVALRRIYTNEYLASHPGEASARREVLVKTDPAAFINACRALESVDYTLLARRVTNPTLIITGSQDAATPPALGATLAKLIPGARFVELPGLAHAPQLQDPRAFLSVAGPYLQIPR
jgi:pimeloyl-ACP methyl ester carboxylesterase